MGTNLRGTKTIGENPRIRETTLWEWCMRKPPKPLPSQEELREHFDYDSQTGNLIRKKRTNGTGRCSLGEPAGHIWTRPHDGRQYVHIKYKYSLYKGHRLVWAWHGYQVPNEYHEMDHINGNTLDNRIENLRIGSNKQNQENRKVKKTSGTGIKGVYFLSKAKTNKYRAYICHHKKNMNLGHFATLEEAIEARKAAERKYFTFI